MKVKDLIKQLLEYDIDSEVLITTYYSEKKKKETRSIGAYFEVSNVDTTGGVTEIIFKDWRDKGE